MVKAPSLVILCLMVTGCSDICDDTVVKRMASPDGRHDAVMFQRDCGATTGFSTQISIVDSGDRLSGMGNAFRADDNHGAARMGNWGGLWVEMRWLSSNHLLVSYAAKSRVFEQDDAVSAVRISYRAIGN